MDFEGSGDWKWPGLVSCRRERSRGPRSQTVGADWLTVCYPRDHGSRRRTSFLGGLHLLELLEEIVARHDQDVLAGHVCFDFRFERDDLAILVWGLGFGAEG